MKILSVNMPADPAVNLKEIKMERLGSIVVIAGKNGAGKSRLLRKMIGFSNSYIDPKRLEDDIRLARVATGGSKSLDLRRQQILRLEKLEIQRAHQETVCIAPLVRPVIIPFVPTGLKLHDPATSAKNALLEMAKSAEAIGISNLPRAAFAVIQVAQNKNWEATHQARTFPSEKAEEAVREYDRLKKLIKDFLGTDITRSVDGDAELFGIKLGDCGLSDGQSVILQLCIAIYKQSEGLNDVILFMDEPENHLHPAALLDLIGVIRARLGTGQLWVATHSLHLLAEFESSSIWWMEENEIKKAGDKPEQVLLGLLGDEDRREKLASFLDLPFILGTNRFAAECITPPEVVSYRPGDPQNTQICSMISDSIPNEAPLRILDLGAGKGRLASEFSERLNADQKALLDYVAFDISRHDAEECLAAIDQLYGRHEMRLFHSWPDLRARYDFGTFHVCVMCNVLHEISPSNWSDLFGAGGKVAKLLSTNGYLLLIEVQRLPYGEQANENGFIVLDTPQLRKLFDIKDTELSKIVVDSRREGWLKAHLIPGEFISRYTAETRRSALEDLASASFDRIREIRVTENKSDYRQGRLHGFWVQQYANAQLALSEV